MALFKNLYLDFSFLNPFKGKGKPVQQKERYILQEKVYAETSAPIPAKKFRELPAISKRLIDDNGIEKAESKAISELPKIRKEISPPPTFSVKTEIKQQIPQPIEPPKPAVIPNNASFFNSLAGHLQKEEGFMHSNMPKELLEKNLFEEMQSFWQNRKGDVNNILYNKAVKTDLMKKIEELQHDESEWQRLQLEHEKLKNELSSREIVIENNVKQLRRAFRKLHVSSDVKEEHFFVLSDGRKLRNLNELKEHLKNMEDSVFFYHVNQSKNDFANWVNDVMGLKELSYNMRKSQTKEQMSDLIENWHNS